MTYQEIEHAAKPPFGGFVNMDVEWCLTRSLEKFLDYLLSIVPLPVLRYGKTPLCTAYVIFQNGLKITWKGCCSYINIS